MKTLLIYHTNRSDMHEMCEACAADDVDVLELRPRYKRRPLIDALADRYRALAGRGVRLAPLDIDFANYDQIILADSLCALAPSAACNEFLYRCDLGGRDVICIVSNRVRYFGRAGRLMRKRVKLAGGVCRGFTYITESDLSKQRQATNILALQQQ